MRLYQVFVLYIDSMWLLCFFCVLLLTFDIRLVRCAPQKKYVCRVFAAWPTVNHLECGGRLGIPGCVLYMFWFLPSSAKHGHYTPYIIEDPYARSFRGRESRWQVEWLRLDSWAEWFSRVSLPVANYLRMYVRMKIDFRSLKVYRGLLRRIYSKRLYKHMWMTLWFSIMLNMNWIEKVWKNPPQYSLDFFSTEITITIPWSHIVSYLII